jgi:anhydro-N-acetylmuramic acid kinase
MSAIAVGVMSGTSCDGMDAVALELRSIKRPHTPRLLGHVYQPFPPGLRRELLEPDRLGPKRLAELHFLLPELYARAIGKLGLERASVCGIHGQTIWHAPRKSGKSIPSTLQVGSSAVVAERVGIPTVGDLRGADVALGGQGAPIVPIAHWMFGAAQCSPQVVVNLGGICNFTYVTRQPDGVLAYDVGPGMMLSDAFAAKVSGGRLFFDAGGELSRGGRPLRPLIEEIIDHDFVRRRPPKSTGREDFGSGYSEQLFRRHRRGSERDVAFSLLQATIAVLDLTLRRDRRIGRRFEKITLTGGGALNPVLVQIARATFPGIPVEVAREGVFAPQNHEPAAVALIAARTLARLPSSLPGVTGARKPAILGHVYWPAA